MLTEQAYEKLLELMTASKVGVYTVQYNQEAFDSQDVSKQWTFVFAPDGLSHRETLTLEILLFRFGILPYFEYAMVVRDFNSSKVREIVHVHPQGCVWAVGSCIHVMQWSYVTIIEPKGVPGS